MLEKMGRKLFPEIHKEIVGILGRLMYRKFRLNKLWY